VAHAQAITTRDIWTEECDEIWKNHLKEMKKKDAVIHNLEDRMTGLAQGSTRRGTNTKSKSMLKRFSTSFGCIGVMSAEKSCGQGLRLT